MYDQVVQSGILQIETDFFGVELVLISLFLVIFGGRKVREFIGS